MKKRDFVLLSAERPVVSGRATVAVFIHDTATAQEEWEELMPKRVVFGLYCVTRLCMDVSFQRFSYDRDEKHAYREQIATMLDDKFHQTKKKAEAFIFAMEKKYPVATKYYKHCISKLSEDAIDAFFSSPAINPFAFPSLPQENTVELFDKINELKNNTDAETFKSAIDRYKETLFSEGKD